MERFDGWDAELYHHGIKGQKWGIRRFQNEDGTLTAAGKKRYFNDDGTLNRHGRKEYMRQYKIANKLIDRANLSKQSDNYLKYQKRKITAAKIAGGLTAGSAAAIGVGNLAGSRALARGLKNAADWQKSADWHKEQAFSEYGDKFKLVNNPEMSKHLYDKSMERARNAEEQAKLWRQGGLERSKNYSSIGSKVAIGLAAGAAVAGGVALYNRHKELAAKTLLTEAGHAKAVSEAKDYVAKMHNAFGNVSVADLKKKAG